MSILVKLSASLRARVPGYDPLAGLETPHQPGLRVAGLLERLGLPPGEVKIIMINGAQAGLDSLVSDGDRVGLFPVLGGG